MYINIIYITYICIKKKYIIKNILKLLKMTFEKQKNILYEENSF